MKWKGVAAGGTWFVVLGLACSGESSPGPLKWTTLGALDGPQVKDACAWVMVGGRREGVEMYRDTVWADEPQFIPWRDWGGTLREGDAGWASWSGVEKWQPDEGPQAMGGTWWLQVEAVWPSGKVDLARKAMSGALTEAQWLEAMVRQHRRQLPEARWQLEPEASGWVWALVPDENSQPWSQGEGLWLDIRSTSVDQAQWPTSAADTTTLPPVQWTFRWGDEDQTLPSIRQFLLRHSVPGVYWWITGPQAALGAQGVPLAGHTPEVPGLYRIEIKRDTTVTGFMNR